MGCICGGSDVVELKPSPRGANTATKDVGQEECSEVYKREIVKEKPVEPIEKQQWFEIAQSPSSHAAVGMHTQVKATLELDTIYGYRIRKCRNNLFKMENGCIIYPAAGVGVINDKKNKQHFMIGHTDDIISLSYHPTTGYVATGEIGKVPVINLWNVNNESKKIPVAASTETGKVRGITALAFSSDGDYLVGIGMDNDHTIFLYHRQNDSLSLITSQKGHSSKILDVEFSPTEKSFVTVGENHIKFWSFADGNLEDNTGVFGDSSKIQTMLSIAYAPDGSIVTGTLKGDLYFWKDRELKSASESVHEGPVYAIRGHKDGFITGGADGKINIWDESNEITSTIDVKEICADSLRSGADYAIRSLDWKGSGTILVGLQDSTIMEIDPETKESKTIVKGHSAYGDAEVWGLATKKQNPDHFASCGDDGALNVWSSSTKSQIGSIVLDQKLRCCDFHPTEEYIATGAFSGSVTVLKADDFSTVSKFESGNEEISDVKFSPNGELLAVASHDQKIYIYEFNSEACTLKNTCKGHTSYITHIDWSSDSKSLQSTSGDRELLYWSVEDGKQMTNSDEIKEISWDSFTCVLGWPMKGIWQSGMDTTDINASCVDPQSDIIATGDDLGKVRLFNFPSDKDTHEAYLGHSSHVTNVRFAYNGKVLLSTGGMDSCVFQWSVKRI